MRRDEGEKTHPRGSEPPLLTQNFQKLQSRSTSEVDHLRIHSAFSALSVFTALSTFLFSTFLFPTFSTFPSITISSVISLPTFPTPRSITTLTLILGIISIANHISPTPLPQTLRNTIRQPHRTRYLNPRRRWLRRRLDDQFLRVPVPRLSLGFGTCEVGLVTLDIGVGIVIGARFMRKKSTRASLRTFRKWFVFIHSAFAFIRR
jgi:hypothetical protein